MPIKPENKALYPANWRELSDAAKATARYTCQHPGCTARHYAVGYWKGEAWIELAPPPANVGVFRGWGTLRQRAAEMQWSKTGDDPQADIKVIVIVLTTAHLDHDPSNCAPENLSPMCQRHHLRYDQQHHNESAYMTRMGKRNNLELPL
jgi:hypothetical protein